MKYLDDQYYHLYNRGSRSEKIFFSDSNYQYFLLLLATNTKRFATSLAAYCLMPNHYHLIVKQKSNGSISKFVQSTMTSYMQAINKKYTLSGSLFQGKAKAKIIDSDEYAVQLIRYIHLNPVYSKIVKTPELWKYSDYSVWFGKEHRLFDDNLQSLYFKNGDEYRLLIESYSETQDKCRIEKFLF